MNIKGPAQKNGLPPFGQTMKESVFDNYGAAAIKRQPLLSLFKNVRYEEWLKNHLKNTERVS